MFVPLKYIPTPQNHAINIGLVHRELGKNRGEGAPPIKAVTI